VWGVNNSGTTVPTRYRYLPYLPIYDNYLQGQYRSGYTREDMIAAIELYKNHQDITLEEAARRTGVPRNTLRDNVERMRRRGMDEVMPPLGRRQVG
jgi:hypothetical protein